MKRRFAQENGFTLIEMLVAGIVLAVGIGAAVTVLVGSGKAGSTAERHDVGVAIAQHEIEEIRSMPFQAVALSATPAYPSSSGQGHPSSRVANGKFSAPGNGQEDLVGGGTLRAYDDSSTDSSLTIGSGAGAIKAKVYRFVSWRNESCSLLPASQLALLASTASGSTLNLLGQLTSTSSSQAFGLGRLVVGTGTGTLQNVINNISGSGSTLGGLLGVLLGPVWNAANGIIAKGNDLLGVANSGTVNSLTTLRNQLSSLSTALAGLGNLDLCNIDLSALRQFQVLQTNLSSLGPLVAAVNGSAANVAQLFGQVNGINCGLLGLNCVLNSVLGNLITTTNTALGTAEPALKNALSNLLNSASFSSLGSTLPTLNTLVDSLGQSTQNSAANARNSKRVTVAVVLDRAGDVGPVQPIWMSTVVSDPKAGLG